MKKTVAILLLLTVNLFISLSLMQAQVPSISQIETESVSVNTGIKFNFYSKTLKEDRVIWVSIPKGYAENSNKYPVLYVLDGQWYFHNASISLDWLSNRQFGLIPQMIIVGIDTGGKNRLNDLSPTKDKQMRAGGGADKFYEFIKEELIPFIDYNYRTYNYRVIAGASLSGLYPLYSFTKDPMLFNGYLCQSPPMWWDNGAMFNTVSDFLSKNPDLENRIYLTMANEGVNQGVDSLAQLFDMYPANNLKWKYDKNYDEIHETIGYKGLWDGMKFLLSDWYFPWFDFGTVGNVFSLKNSSLAMDTINEVYNLQENELDNFTGLYVDTYERVLEIKQKDKKLLLSNSELPTLVLHPKTKNSFFLMKKDMQDSLFLKGVDFQFDFTKKNTLIVKANGRTECTAKKVKDLKLIALPNEKMKEYEGEYIPLQFGNNFRIYKDGGLLKMIEVLSPKESDERFLAYLYPVGENKFFAFYNANSYDVVYNKSESKFIYSIKGNIVFEIKKKTN